VRPHRDHSQRPFGQWAAPGGQPAYLTEHGAATEEIGRLRWTLNQVIGLADDAPGLTSEQLRDRLLGLADQARRRCSDKVTVKPRPCHTNPVDMAGAAAGRAV
jgi:hypothetical protein